MKEFDLYKDVHMKRWSNVPNPRLPGGFFQLEGSFSLQLLPVLSSGWEVVME